MKKRKYISSETYSHDEERCYEHPTGVSQTVAGESYTVKELFDRYAAGQVVGIQRESYYEDTQDFDAIDFQALRYADPFEKQELLEEVQAKAKRASDAIQKWKEEQESDTDDPATSKKSSQKKPSQTKNQKADQGEPGEPASKRSNASDANSGEPPEI